MKNKDKISEKGTILSGYVRYRPSNGTFYLMINSRMLCTALSKKKEKINVKITRKGDFFITNICDEGNILKLRNKELVACISGRNLLTTEERRKLTGEKTKFSFPVKVKLFPQEFELDKYSLYPDQDAAKLGRILDSKGIKIPNRIMTPKEFLHDLEFVYNNKKAIIEITQTKPGKLNSSNFRHQAQGGAVRTHIFDIYRGCVNSVLSNKKDVVGFVILHEKWNTHNHVISLVPELKKLKCYILFSNFNKGWENNCSKLIMEKLK